MSELKREAKESLLQIYKWQKEKDGRPPMLPHDIVDVLDVGHPSEISEADLKKIFTKVRPAVCSWHFCPVFWSFNHLIFPQLRERWTAVERKEKLTLSELELDETLQRWESHINDTQAQKDEAIRQFNEEEEQLKLMKPVRRVNYSGKL